MNKRLRTGDQVIVIKGNDKGKIGKILMLLEGKFIVEGINVRKKHKRKTQENKKGQIIDIETPISAANVRLAVDEKPRKLRARLNADGEKELYYFDGNKNSVSYRLSKNEKSK